MRDEPPFPTSELEIDPLLLDFHLGQLPDGKCAELRERVGRDAKLAAHDRVLSSALAALRSAPAPLAPHELTNRILQRVASAASVRVWSPAPPHTACEGDGGGAGGGGRMARLYSFRDVLAVAAVIVVAVALGVPGLLHMRERSQRARCSMNLAQLGRAIQTYALVFNNHLPFVGWNGRSSWKPTSEPGVEIVPNRRHLYPLLQARYTQADCFICPSSRDIPMPVDEIQRRGDFLESRNVSYANQNMAGVRPTLGSHAALPVLADDNPVFENGLPLLDLAARRLGLSDPSQANSRAHRGTGQNLLTLCGTVKWVTSPNAGIDADNIWTLRRVGQYTGREGPQDPTDSHLLK